MTVPLGVPPKPLQTKVCPVFRARVPHFLQCLYVLRVVGAIVVDGDGEALQGPLEDRFDQTPPPARKRTANSRHVQGSVKKSGLVSQLRQTSLKGIVLKRNVAILIFRASMLVLAFGAIALLSQHVADVGRFSIHEECLNLPKLERHHHGVVREGFPFIQDGSLLVPLTVLPLRSPPCS